MDKKQRKHNRFRSTMTKEQTDALRGTEIVSKRTRCGKVFAMGGNRFQAVTYTDPVHRYNEKTRSWDEIDNRFTATPRMKETRAAWKKGIMPAVERGESLLECKTGNLDIDCSVAGEAPFITLTDKAGRQLSWGIEGATSILPDAEEIQDAAPANVRQLREKALSRLHGEVVYGGIFSGVDLRCKLDRGFKDELIFNAAECVRPVTFLLQSEGRTMELTEENALLVKDDQANVVFSLEAPFLEDAKQNVGAVAVQMIARSEGVYALTYTPDAEFMANAIYPVVLDPAVQVGSDGNGITDTYVEKGYTDNCSQLNRLWVCDSNGNCNAYLRVDELPAIGSNHYITSAFLCVHNYSAPSVDTTLVISEVLESWDPSTITYAQQPLYADVYQDCCVFPANTYTERKLDVTSLARKWYLGENYGVVFTPAPTTQNDIAISSSEGNSKPYFVVNYASLAGLESYLSYDTQAAGLAGQGYVSLVNGNLIFAHNDTSMNGNRLPVSVTHYYNSCDSDKNEFGMGYGWRTSLHQTIHKEYINDEVMYVYTDGDGTEHWFELDDDADEVQYKDMSGLSLTLTVDDNGIITIKSKSDGRMVFPAILNDPTTDAPITAKKLIASIHDAVGNQITITPVDGATLRIQSVTDGAGRVTTFTYADGLCDSIRTPWQEDDYTQFSYSNGQMTYITHEDGRTAAYAYEIRNGYSLLTNTSSVDGVAVAYTYSNTGAIDGLPHCIQRVIVTGTQDGITRTASDISYSYGNHMALCTDNLSGTLQTQARSTDSETQRAPKSIRRHFNDNGNETSIDDELGYAVYTRYDQTGDNEDAPVNHATTRSRMQRVVKNLLADSMFALDGADWEKSGVTRDVSTWKWGNVSFKLAGSETGSYIRQLVTLTPGEYYTFSGYLRSSAEKTFLRVIYTMNGETYHFDSDPATVLASPSGKPFEREAVSFKLPVGADPQVYCAVMCMGSSGYGWASCMQLEEGRTCNHFNLVQDQACTSVATDTAATTCWRVGNDSLSAYLSTKPLAECAVQPPAILTGRALHLDAHYNPNYNLSIEQELKVSGKKNDRFTVGGWCSTFAKLHNEEDGTYCCIDVLFPSGSYWISGGKAVFNHEEGSWQFACAGVTAPKDFSRILIRVNMSKQMNYADLTGLFLYPEAFGTDYTYDAKGNPVNSRAPSGAVQSTTFDDADNLTQYTAPGHTLSSTFNYGADSAMQKQHLLRSACSPLGTRSYFGYDAHGNGKRSDTCGTVGSTDFITRATSEFQHADNYVHTQTDARGKTVTTEIDANKGIITSVTDPKGQTVVYEHDAQRRVTKVVTTVDGHQYRNEYTYDQTRGMLTGVKHNVDDDTTHDVAYTFEYDHLGRKTRVLVGAVVLSANVYQNDPNNANYGTLTEMQYGNGTVVRNTYDDFNRVTGVRYDDEVEPRYEYAYNANGQVAFVKNNLIQHVVESEYDLSNRPCRIKTHKVTEDADGNITSSEHVYTGEVAYDDVFARMTKFTERVGEDRTEYVTEFGYDEENRPTSLGYGEHGQSTIEYDALGRVSKTTVKAGSGAASETTYTYVEGAALETEAPEDADDERKAAAENAAGKTSTTGLVASISQTGGNFTYTYDDNGNIISVVQDGVTTSYTYDALGQLIRVVDDQEGAAWEYEYDQGGNILSKKKYVEGTLEESKTFTYGNANWRDQLTAVNGVAITYDQIGNPLNDGTWQYTWQSGRLLARMQSVDTDASFVYNENGLRVQKTVNGIVTNYTLHGKNVVHLTRGNDELHFFYDAQNEPAVMVYNGTPYSYVKNLQGDIVAILDANGAVVVSYVYDAWGSPISKTGTLASTLGTVQPFRYRGYVYDEETELYYLRSRYYNPVLCRFVNSDILIGRGKSLSHNLYAYCSNRVVCYADASGLEETLSVHYVRCAPGIEIPIGNGVTVKRGDVIISKSMWGDYSIITLSDGRTGQLKNSYITSLKPLGFADAYGEPEMNTWTELDPEKVANLQRDLYTLGYYRGEIDGIYGKDTMAAVAAFGEAEGLGTGPYAGPKVKKRLFQRMYAQYDHQQDKEAQSYWDGYNAYRQELKEKFRERMRKHPFR